MALNYVTLTGQVSGGAGATATFMPSAWLTDATDNLLIPPASKAVTLDGTGKFSVLLLATDNGAPLPSGWSWQVAITGIPDVPTLGFSFFLPFASGAAQDLADITPAQPTPALSTFLPLPSGVASAGLVPIATGSGENSAWGTPPGGTPSGAAGGALSGTYPNPGLVTVPIASGGTGQITQQAAIDALAGGVTAAQFLRGNGTHVLLAPIAAGDLPAGTTSAQGALQLDGTAGDIAPLGTQAAGVSPKAAAADHVHSNTAASLSATTFIQGSRVVATGLAGATAASRYVGATASGAPASGTFVTGDFVIDQSANVWVCTAGGTPGTWGKVGTGGTVTGVTAADTSVVIGGTATAPTVRTATLDVVAAQHPPAAAVAMNGQKMTGLANGTAATDGAAFGQIPLADSTATDITQVGTSQSAGISTKWAAADHVHPDPNPLPADFGYVAWTSDPGNAGQSSTLPLGSLVLVEFFVRVAGQTIANIGIQVTTAQSGTSNQNFAGIYDTAGGVTGTLRGQSADQTTNWASAAARATALTSAYTNVPAGRYYAAWLVNGTTSPTFRTSAATPAIGNLNLSGASGNLRFATFSSGLTALPSTFTLASMVTTNAQCPVATLF